ncbi:MAG: hypothetical protein R6X05_00485 [Desulfobacterales bacterium]
MGSTSLQENGRIVLQGPGKKINLHLACLFSRPRRYIHRRISRYAQANVPCRCKKIRCHPVDLFLSVNLRRKRRRRQTQQIPFGAFFKRRAGVIHPAEKFPGKKFSAKSLDFDFKRV